MVQINPPFQTHRFPMNLGHMVSRRVAGVAVRGRDLDWERTRDTVT